MYNTKLEKGIAKLEVRNGLAKGLKHFRHLSLVRGFDCCRLT
jgi:hypothetical protein